MTAAPQVCEHIQNSLSMLICLRPITEMLHHTVPQQLGTLIVIFITLHYARAIELDHLESFYLVQKYAVTMPCTGRMRQCNPCKTGGLYRVDAPKMHTDALALIGSHSSEEDLYIHTLLVQLPQTTTGTARPCNVAIMIPSLVTWFMISIHSPRLNT